LAAKNFATSLENAENEAIVDVYLGMNKYSGRVIPYWYVPLVVLSYGVGSTLLVPRFRAMRRPLAAG